MCAFSGEGGCHLVEKKSWALGTKRFFLKRREQKGGDGGALCCNTPGKKRKKKGLIEKDVRGASQKQSLKHGTRPPGAKTSGKLEAFSSCRSSKRGGGAPVLGRGQFLWGGQKKGAPGPPLAAMGGTRGAPRGGRGALFLKGGPKEKMKRTKRTTKPP